MGERGKEIKGEKEVERERQREREMVERKIWRERDRARERERARERDFNKNYINTYTRTNKQGIFKYGQFNKHGINARSVYLVMLKKQFI